MFGGKAIFTECWNEVYERFTRATTDVDMLKLIKTNEMGIGGNAPNALFYGAQAERLDVGLEVFKANMGGS